MGLLRLVLALSVVMAHGLTALFGMRLFDGAGAVWIFFTISGFLITLALMEKYSGGPGALRDFYFNRAIRLYPAYWCWVVATILAYWWIPADALTYQRTIIAGSDQATGFWKDHVAVASFTTVATAAVANLTGLFADSLLYLGLDPADGTLIPNPHQQAGIWAIGFMFIGQYWSIGVELCFYVVAPWIVRSRARIAVMFAASVGGWLESMGRWVGTVLHWPALEFIQMPRFLWMFMLGAMLTHAMRDWSTGPKSKRAVTFTLLAVLYVVIAWRGVDLFVFASFTWWLFVIVTAAIPLLFVVTARSRIDRFLGELSYPVYVNHFIVIQVLGSIAAPQGWAFAAASIALAALTTVLIERPTRRWKRPGVTAAATSRG